ncbi:MAG: hypothetical protein H6706_04535 [Myxococcales bacterium]|nr:hypothetical protein [Myxococcales bacterium]
MAPARGLGLLFAGLLLARLVEPALQVLWVLIDGDLHGRWAAAQLAEATAIALAAVGALRLTGGADAGKLALGLAGAALLLRALGEGIIGLALIGGVLQGWSPEALNSLALFIAAMTSGSALALGVGLAARDKDRLLQLLSMAIAVLVAGGLALSRQSRSSWRIAEAADAGAGLLLLVLVLWALCRHATRAPVQAALPPPLLAPLRLHLLGLRLRLGASALLAATLLAGSSHLIALARDLPQRVLFGLEGLAGLAMGVAALGLWRLAAAVDALPHRVAALFFSLSAALSAGHVFALALDPVRFRWPFIASQGLTAVALLALLQVGTTLGDDASRRVTRRARAALLAALGSAVIVTQVQRPGLGELLATLAVTLAVGAALAWLAVVQRLVRPHEAASVHEIFE